MAGWMTARTLILVACGLVALFPLGRIFFLFGWREPRLSREISSDYHERDQAADYDAHRGAQFDNFLTEADFHTRGVTERVAYMVDGTEYRYDVDVIAHKGYAPDPQPIVWIDPAKPDRATARGPGYWTMWLLLDAFVALPAWLLLS